MALELLSILEKPDLVFVDGGCNRAEQAHAALDCGADMIVMHDFTEDSFDYAQLRVPSRYTLYRCLRDSGPPTGVMTTRDLGAFEVPRHQVIQVVV